MNDVFTRSEARYNPEHDRYQTAYRAGWTHAYFGLDSGWSDEETMDGYRLGERDGESERQIAIKQTGIDPHSW